ncbi:syntaxin-2-like isoform X2 [Halichoeres trimaculatus]|uniref:syntaxin-2-like isoform X2 n=1 Tax=Halichoeres trimaculatus TaxID=147232 RepID=UPI003D9DC464
MADRRDSMTAAAESSLNIEDFFKKVGEVRSLIETISSQVEEVERRHGAILSGSDHDKKSKKELERLNNETKKNANLVRAMLKSMQKDFLEDDTRTRASVIHRIHQNQISHLTRWFADVIRGYHKAQICFKEKCKAKIQRQLEIVNKRTTDEELEEMLHRDNLTIFISDINSNAQVSSQALSEIESRHQDILCLESSIKELHEVFADTAMLLENQGELINNIEKNVMSAAEFVDESKNKTDEALTYKKNPYKIASMPSFFKSFKRQASTKTAHDKNNPEVNHD